MSHSPPTPDEGPAGAGPEESPVAASTLPKEALPPVEPPTAGFIIQLFFIPLVIVSIIVAVWLMFSWMAQMGSRPEDLVASLERLDPGSWQSAKTLADILRTSHNDEVRNNSELASRLATLLDSQLTLGEAEAAGDFKEHQKMEQVFLRSFLCRVLGEFEVTDGVPVLIQATVQEEHPAEIKVRRSAAWALSQHLARGEFESWPWGDTKQDWPEQQALMTALLEASMEQDENERTLLRVLDDEARAERDRGKTKEQLEDEAAQREMAADRLALRSTAVFALGLIGTPEALDHLALKLADQHPDVRANAAAGLARQGDARGVETLLKMLDPASAEFVEREAEADRLWKRSQVMMTATSAALLYAQAQPGSAETESLRAAIETVIADETTHPEVVDEAQRALEQIEDLQRSAGEPAPAAA